MELELRKFEFELVYDLWYTNEFKVVSDPFFMVMVGCKFELGII